MTKGIVLQEHEAVHATQLVVGMDVLVEVVQRGVAQLGEKN